MKVLVAGHPSALLHDTGRFHPERPGRVEAVRSGVVASGLEVVEMEAPLIERSELALVHDYPYIEMIEDFCSRGGGALDMDTVVSPESWEAACRAAGAVRALAEEMASRTDVTGLALCRPPGHHALPDRAMGFCIFNNAAVTAVWLRSRGHRVAIIDWDVHHGNGTQAAVAHDPGILYVSLHQDHFYPFEGEVEDIDNVDVKGTVVNIPLPAGTGGAEYRRAWAEIVIPVVSQFEPDWVLLSAGYDAHTADRLAGLNLMDGDYGWMAAQLARVHPANRTIVVLEGGYDLDALRESSAATLLGLAGAFPDAGHGMGSPKTSARAVDRAAAVIAGHWPL